MRKAAMQNLTNEKEAGKVVASDDAPPIVHPRRRRDLPGSTFLPGEVSFLHDPDATEIAEGHSVNDGNAGVDTFTRRDLATWLNDVLPSKEGPQDMVRRWQWKLRRRGLGETLTRLDGAQQNTGGPPVYSQTILRRLRSDPIFQPTRNPYTHLDNPVGDSLNGLTHPDEPASSNTQ